jgi:hypothetical protein
VPSRSFAFQNHSSNALLFDRKFCIQSYDPRFYLPSVQNSNKTAKALYAYVYVYVYSILFLNISYYLYYLQDTVSFALRNIFSVADVSFILLGLVRNSRIFQMNTSILTVKTCFTCLQYLGSANVTLHIRARGFTSELHYDKLMT